MSPDSTCEDLAKEGLEVSKHNLSLSAKILEDTGKCFDRSGKRKEAGKYYTMAGDFYIDLNKTEKAANCYGKAILRYLMIDDFDTAQLLLDKGTEYGFSNSFHQFRIAQDALKRKTSEEVLENEEDESFTIATESLPEIDILPIEDESVISQVSLESLTPDEDVLVSSSDFIIPQLEDQTESTINTFSVLAAVSKATRTKPQTELVTNAVVKNKLGESFVVKPRTILQPKQPTKSKTIEETDTSTKEFEPIVDIFDSDSILDISDTLDLDYTAKTEILNEFEDELLDIEIVDTIPFKWQVVDVKSDFSLEEKKKTQSGVVFTWKSEKINPGSKLSVEYVLRKRVERTIILRKESTVSVITTYHSVKRDLETKLEFVNTSSKIFHEILIEDIIPPELIVCNTETKPKLKPITIPTHDSTMYRWIFNKLNPGDTFEVNYTFREKPLTRHYIDEIITPEGKILIEKISQPMIDSLTYEYLWFYLLNNESSHAINLKDRIPLDFEIVSIDPIHLNPTIERQSNHKVLTWNFTAEEKKTIILLRIKGKESFTPLEPSFNIPKQKEILLIDKNSNSEKKLIDLRRLKGNMEVK
ncbi:MAG: hypothetical protein ACTSW1_02305 [Candidatus Hodarchaeales archaeon]